ncbi:MAG: neutral/alkaline non-lysosomal ceramidase N-terminal domain-containing protein [Dehalococcoidia bacterium]
MPLHAGAARTVVTPPVGYRMGQWGLRKGRSEGIYRDLFARALVLADGQAEIAIVSVDVCGFPEAVSAAIHNRINELTGIPTKGVLLSSTHNHTAPDFLLNVPDELRDYSAVFADAVAGSVYAAQKSARLARVGWGSGDLPGWTVNRQYRERNVETEVGVLRVDGADGSPIAHVVNWACHGVCDGGQYLVWSGDFAGEMSAHMEDSAPGSVALFVQGAAGDIHPFDWWFGNMDSRHMHTHEDTRALGEALGEEVIRVSASCEMHDEVAVKSASSPIALPRHRVRWSAEEAETLQRDLEQVQTPYSGDVWPEGTTTANAAVRHPELYGRGANELNLARNQDKPPVEAEIGALKIGDLAIATLPGELFNELGRQLKNSRHGPTWCAAYCRGYIGYVSTRRPHEETDDVPLTEIVDMKRFRRYYGTTTSPFSPEAGEMMIKRASDLLKEVDG